MDYGCLFCNILNNNIDFINDYDTIIFSTDNFFVIPGKGQIVPNYFLIVSKEHLLNIRQLNTERLLEIEYIKSFISDYFKFTTGKLPVFFEHGSISCNLRAGTCVDHAHLHTLPADIFVLPEFLATRLKGKSIRSYLELLVYPEIPYFYMELSNKHQYIFEAENIPSQFGRQLIHTVLPEAQEWDWRKKKNHSDMYKTIAFTKNMLPKFIMETKPNIEYNMFFNCLSS